MQNRRRRSTGRISFFLCFFLFYVMASLLSGSPMLLVEAAEIAATAETAEIAETAESAETTAIAATAEIAETTATAETAESAETAETAETEWPNLQLYAKSALLMDASNNRVLYEKNGYEVLPMASTTKIMTALLALEYGNLEDTVTVSAYAASMPKVHLGMREGETYKLKDLLFSLMLESHNDSAVAIAEHIGGSVEGFADMMNQKARDLGCEDTFFITPNGLDAASGDQIHSTTAYDLAKIAAYAIQNELFVALVGTQSYQFCELQGGRSFQVTNKDRFLSMMDGAIGIKTGFTNQAGYCFVGALKREDRTLVSVVLASGWPPHKDYKWADTRALMEIGTEDYSIRTIEKKEIPAQIPVANGVEAAAALEMDWQDTALLLADWDTVSLELEIADELEAPVEAGEIVGYEKLLINGEVYAAAPVKTAEEVLEYTYPYCIRRVLTLFLYGRECG